MKMKSNMQELEEFEEMKSIESTMDAQVFNLISLLLDMARARGLEINAEEMNDFDLINTSRIALAEHTNC
jgi:hypothetical protein